MKNPYSIPGKKTIEQAVCDEWGVTMDEIRSGSRKNHLPDARKVIMYYHRTYDKHPFELAAASVNKDHASAIVACRKFVDFMQVDPYFREKATRAISQVSWNHTPSVRDQTTGEGSYNMKLTEDLLVISFPAPVCFITFTKPQLIGLFDNIKKVVCIEEEII